MRRWRVYLVLAALAPWPVGAVADDFYAVRPADIACVVQAAQRQGVPANVLLAISSKESGRNGQSVANHNGTFDLGHFQINTTHWGPRGVFAAYPTITKSDVAWRGCYNAELAAWLLRQKLEENNGQDFWTRVANYHSRTHKFNDIYKKGLIPLAVKWGRYLERQRPHQYMVSYQ